ncbi:hypothetical protein O181_061817 [Austropuccinia psidii MF-1]|uniref:Integrase catalytic domain-containing protein n=1 Tax=Austropuccinia psidii MF-1 TaxID=1389203 RepID=A0A9Q3HZS8_9BASI|nr:hypothetical protein [Austropuccinia psidii MF-1]
MQEDGNGKDRPVLCEPVTFSQLESKYSHPKLELCCVARILKKLQTILWGKHFELQVDAKALIEMINTPCLPNAPMTRWVAFIKLFSFDLVHKPGKTFTIPGGLSKRPKGVNEDESERDDFDEEEERIKPHPGFGLKEVNTSKVGKLSRNKTNNIGIPIKQEGFGTHMQEYLNSLKKPQSIGEEYLKRIKRRSVNFYIEGGKLKRRNQETPQMVVFNDKAQKHIVKKMQKELGHKGENETYRRIKKRYWWEGMKKIVNKWVKSCQECQERSHLQQKEEGKISATLNSFSRVSMDAVHIKAGRWKYLVVARDDFSGWPETVTLTRLTAKSVSEWFNSEWICRYGAPKEVTVEGGAEFGKELQEAVKRAGSRIRITTPYYPEVQGMVERVHKQLKDSLVKMCGENGSKWKEYLPILTLEDRILVNKNNRILTI